MACYTFTGARSGTCVFQHPQSQPAAYTVTIMSTPGSECIIWRDLQLNEASTHKRSVTLTFDIVPAQLLNASVQFHQTNFIHSARANPLVG